MNEDDDDEPVELPVTGELDLHAFAPRDIPAVVEEYVRLCRERGILRLRLVHGRGKGVQRAVVRQLLAQLHRGLRRVLRLGRPGATSRARAAAGGTD
jgi:DNA-nicking Smr family endonuclease